ncbi:hypothetical protein [Nonomuraea sp. NPDC048916]|uniref:WD40 repeat domain-containing protein n=1 Tax=Nonomuraea sp. NPDC048916 TaxID=3154232 RepID=UPI0033C59858
MLRTAYLITGDARWARGLTVEALITVGRRWSSLRANRPVDAALRELYRRALDVQAGPPAGFPLDVLEPRGRAALVAQFHDSLHPYHAADLCGLGPFGHEETARSLHRLRTAWPALFTPHPAAPDTAPGPPEDTGEPPAEQAEEAWTLPDAEGGTGGWSATKPAQGTGEGAPAGVEMPQVGFRAEPALHRTLVRMSAEATAGTADVTGLTQEVLRGIRRAKRVRRAVAGSVSAVAVASFVAIVYVGLTVIAENARNVADPMATPESDLFPTSTPAKAPDPVPERLEEAVRFAYTGYCERSGATSAADPPPCAQWRLVTASGDEWRLDGARAGFGMGTDGTGPLALSQDGHRVAYQNEAGDYVVQDLATGTARTVELARRQDMTYIVSSPNGRYFAIGFDGEKGAVLDFDTGTTSPARGGRVLAVMDDGRRVVTGSEDVTNVPGHASVTTLGLEGPSGRGGRPYRIDPALIEYGAALSPDGRTLAVVAGDERLALMNVRTGLITGPRPSLDDYEIVAVERWLNQEEVLVRLWDDDDELLVAVNIRTGSSEPYAEEITEEMDYGSPLGRVTG